MLQRQNESSAAIHYIQREKVVKNGTLVLLLAHVNVMFRCRDHLSIKQCGHRDVFSIDSISVVLFNIC